MAEGSGKLTADPLFLGLTRPPMVFGVSFPFVLVNVVVSFISFINTGNFLFMFMLFPLHGIGYIICFKEPLFLELYMLKLSKCNTCKNKFFHGYTNSYDVY